MAFEQLEQQQYKRFVGSHELSTGYLGPCTGVIIHHENEMDAFVGHFVDPEERNGLEEMIQDALKAYGSPADMRVYVAGCSYDHVLDADDPPEGERQEDYIRQFRASTTELIQHYMFCPDKTKIHWSPDDSTANLNIYLDAGLVFLNITSDYDLFPDQRIILSPPNAIRTE